MAVSATALACAGSGGDKATEPDGDQPSPGTVVGSWSGTTSQGQPLSILVTSAGIPLVMIGTSVQGTSCTSTLTTYLSRLQPETPYSISGGAFTITSSGSRGTLTLAGTLGAGGSGTGTVNVNDTQCNGTLAGTWSATRASSAEVNVTGTWFGNFASSLVSRIDGTLSLTQNGSSVTGTYAVDNGAEGKLTGTVSGRTMTFSLSQTTSECTGSFSGQAVLRSAPELLVYFYTGSDCLGAHSFGNGAASR